MKSCCVVGLGYIGLPTAILLAKNNCKVVGVDINKEVLIKINSENYDTNEPDLKESLKEVREINLFETSSKPVESDVFIICVPTPFKENNNQIGVPEPDISYVLNAAKDIASKVKPNNLVLLESTCPVGTTIKVLDIIAKYSGLEHHQIHVAYCPERVIPGNIFKELQYNSRVVGGISKKASSEGKIFYKLFCKGEIFETDSKTAELVKLSENAFRDINIAFANEISMICDELDIETSKVIKIANKHPRVNILNPGCGVGGHCIAVDPWFIAHSSPKSSKLIQTARQINNHKSEWVYEKIKMFSNNYALKNSKKPTIALMGLSYKPDIDDFRESSSMKIAIKCANEGLDIVVCEPFLKNSKLFKMIELKNISKMADILIFLVGHSCFKDLDIKNKKYLDFCGIFEFIQK